MAGPDESEVHSASVLKSDHHEGQSAGNIKMLIKVKERQLLGYAMLLPVIWFALEPLPAAFILQDSKTRIPFLCLSCITALL